MLLLLAAALLSGGPAGAQRDAAEIQKKARALLADSRYQRELPAHPPPDVNKTVGRPAGLPAPELPVNLPVLGAGASLAQIVFVVLVIVVILLVLGWIFRELIQRQGRTRTDTDGTEEPEAAETSEREPAFEDAARLAGEGRYAEAIHALLLATIRHFAERSRTSIQPSRTSRELVRLLPLGAEAREAFTELVRTVELSLFGGVPVGRDEYERSLSRFRALVRRPA